MKKIRIMVVTGTRPELIKVSVLLRLISQDADFHLIFIHSGQHYDELLSNIFFKDLEIPEPNYNLNVGSHPNSIQTAMMLTSLYEIMVKEKPDVMLAQGDTNTVFAAALTAFKNNIPFAHLESGIRSYDLRMPEEVNRMLTGICSLLNFAPTKAAAENLLNEGITPDRIFQVGNSIVDAVLNNIELAKLKSSIDQKLKINDSRKIILLTAHRPSNVDQKETMMNILSAIPKSDKIRIIYPVHPRTRKKIEEFGLLTYIQESTQIELIEPLGYLDFLKLMSLSYLILTDSGGLQEEANILNIPCLTLRENTERPETVELGVNILVGNDKQKISYNINKLLQNAEIYESMRNKGCPFGDGKTSENVLSIIKAKFNANQLTIPFLSYSDKLPKIKLKKLDMLKNKKKIEEYEKENSCKILEIFDSDGNIIIPEPTHELQSDFMIKVRKLE